MSGNATNRELAYRCLGQSLVGRRFANTYSQIGGCLLSISRFAVSIR